MLGLTQSNNEYSGEDERKNRCSGSAAPGNTRKAESESRVRAEVTIEMNSLNLHGGLGFGSTGTPKSGRKTMLASDGTTL